VTKLITFKCVDGHIEQTNLSSFNKIKSRKCTYPPDNSEYGFNYCGKRSKRIKDQSLGTVR